MPKVRCIACGGDYPTNKHSMYDCAERQGFELLIHLDVRERENPKTGERYYFGYSGARGLVEMLTGERWGSERMLAKLRRVRAALSIVICVELIGIAALAVL